MINSTCSEVANESRCLSFVLLDNGLKEYFIADWTGEAYQAVFPTSLSDLSCDFHDIESCTGYIARILECISLWDELGNIPTVEGEIDEGWHVFPRLTCIEHIWHWFESEFGISVAKHLMFNPVSNHNIEPVA